MCHKRVAFSLVRYALFFHLPGGSARGERRVEHFAGCPGTAAGGGDQNEQVLVAVALHLQHHREHRGR